MKNFLIFILFLVVLVFGYFAFIKDKVRNDINNGETVSTEENLNNAPFIGVATEQNTEEESATFRLKAKYPSFNNEAIDKQIRSLVNQESADFKLSANNLPAGMSAKAFLGIDYLTFRTSKILSVVLTVTDYLGGAHGNLRIKTLNYDLETGEELSIGSLFEPGADYLARLSQLVGTDLKQKYATDEITAHMIDEGTTPTNSNFNAFYFKSDQTFVLVFQPYQVGPWSIGAPQVEINLDDIKDILDENYR